MGNKISEINKVNKINKVNIVSKLNKLNTLNVLNRENEVSTLNRADKSNKLNKDKKQNGINGTSRIFKRFFKLSIVTVLIVTPFLLSGCKNTDTYLNSEYFKDNYSAKIPSIISAQNEDDSVLLAKTVVPAIVAISATNGGVINIGSGVCVKSGGYILTNYHVIENAKDIKLFFHDNSTSSALLIWKDKIMDIAILKSSVAIPYLEMGDNVSTSVGENIVAVGTPLSLNFTHSFTKGIVSAINRTIKINTENGEALMQNLIQHDASINPGNSGGPLINNSGQVIGINTLKISTGEGMGFAIPINAVSSIVEKVYGNYNYVTPYVGIYSQDASLESAYSDADNSKTGVLVIDVAVNSPAEVHGIKSGDIIVKINEINITNALDFRKEFYRYNVGETIKILINRNEKNIEIDFQLIEHPYNYILVD